MRQSYPSDMRPEQFEKLLPLLERARKKTRPHEGDWYEVFGGMTYVLKRGCQWRMLPREFPKWRTGHSSFQQWSEPQESGIRLLEEALKNVVGAVRQRSGRLEKPSFLIIDAQSVQNTDTAAEKGYAGGKLVSGIQRHLAGDMQGLPHAIHVTTATVTDRTGAVEAFRLHQTSRGDVTNVLADAGYTGNTFADSVQEILGCPIEIAKRRELHTVVVIPNRWVVERSFAWLDKCRRLWKNCERKLQTSLSMAVLAFLILCTNRL